MTIIPAILDFEKAIVTFKNASLLLLELGEVSIWDGKVLQEREQAIRQAAMELAGQCTALLLKALSEDQMAFDVANQRTRESRGFGSQSQGKKAVKVLTVGNVEVSLNVNYVLSRFRRKDNGNQQPAKTQKSRGKESGQGFYSFLRWLGMEEKVTPLVWSTVAFLGMMSTSFAIARNQLTEWGITLSEQRIERLTYSFGKAGIQLTEQWMEKMREGELPVGETFRGQRVGLNVDGGRTRLRRNKKGKPRANGRRGYYGDWKEPKLFTLYAMDEQGNKINTIELPVTNDGTFDGIEAFMDLLEMYLVKLGVVHANQVLLVADGALWIWQRIPALLKRLGLKTEQLIELIDFYHAAEHLQKFAELVFKKKKEAKAWFKKARSKMRHKSFRKLLKDMQRLVNSIEDGKKKSDAESSLDYFSEQPQRFAYRQVKAKNLPIGSGAIESLIRQVVNLRLKGTGKFWLHENAEIILHGRCQWAAGQWNRFSHSVLIAGLSSQVMQAV
jgi:hypothetical protein